MKKAKRLNKNRKGPKKCKKGPKYKKTINARNVKRGQNIEKIPKKWPKRTNKGKKTKNVKRL